MKSLSFRRDYGPGSKIIILWQYDKEQRTIIKIQRKVEDVGMKATKAR
jgi:hypothetical protein